MERGFTVKEQNLYDDLITKINNLLYSQATIEMLIKSVDELVDELLRTNDDGMW